MAVQTSTSTIRAMGNGAATVFSFAPIILLSNVDEMHVYEIDDDDNEVEITTGFTVSVSSFPGTGDVTFDTAPVDGTNLLFRRQVEITQLTRLFNQGAFDPQVIERALDKLTLIAADLKSVEEDRAADDEEINEIIQEYLRLNHTEVNTIIREYIEDNDIGTGGPGNVSAYAYLFTQSFTLAEDTTTQMIPITGDGLIINVLDETNAGGPIIQGFPFIVEWEGVLELQIDQAREIELILKTTHNLNGKTFTHPRSYKFNLVANTRFTVPLTVFNSHAILRAGTYNIGGEEVVLTDADFLADTMISYEFEIIARRRSDDSRRAANVTNIELVNACQIAFQLRRAVSEGGGDGVDQTARNIATAALPKSGGVMTGTLILKGDPAADLEAATKQYVDDNTGGDSVTIVDALPETIPDAGTALILRDPVGERDEGVYIVKSHGGDYYEGAVVNSIDSIIAVQANLDNNPNGSVSELEWTLNGLHIYAEFHNSAFAGSPPANLYIEITHLDTAGGAIGAADELSSGDRANSRVTLARQSSFDRLGHYSYGNQLSGATMTLWGGVDVGERLRFKVYTDAGYSTPLVSAGDKYYDLITEDKFPHQMALVRLAQGGATDGQTLVWDDDNNVWAPADAAAGGGDIPTVLAGTRLPTGSDGSDGDFWVAGIDNGGTLSISENVEGAYVEIGRASYDKDAVASLQHLTRDVHITDLITTWSAVDNSDADLYWTVPVNNAITLTDANFNNQGTSITIPSSVSPRTNYVFVRLPAATSVTPLRMRQGGNVAGSNVWALAADEGVTVPDNDAFQYWMAVINLQETAAETWVLEERETVDHTRFDGELGGRALEEARNDGRFSALEHLTRDLHINTDTPDWSDAADSEGDLFQVLDPGSAVTLTDANFNNNGSGIQIPDGQNADTLIYARLPAAADHTTYRITFDDREPRGGNTWARVNGPDTSTYQYWFVYSVNNFGFSFVQLEKRSSLEDTTYTGSGAVPPGGTTAQAIIKSSNDDYDIEWGTVSGGGGGTDTTARNAAAAAQATADAALPKAGGTMTGKITLDGAPTANLHAATKAYVDANAGGSGVEDQTARNAAAAAQATANLALPRSGGAMSGKLTLDGAPTANLHAATKKYVDDIAGTDSTARTAAATAQTTADAAQTTADAALSRSGGTMTGALTLRGAPTADLQAATKKYVDEAVSDAVADDDDDGGDFLELIGASSGAINLDANTVADTGIDLPADIPSGEVWAVRIGNERYDDLEFFLASEINSRSGTTIGVTPLDPDTAAGRAAGVLIRGKRQGASQNDLLLLAKDTGDSGHILIASTHQGLDPEVTLYRVKAGGGASVGPSDVVTKTITSVASRVVLTDYTIPAEGFLLVAARVGNRDSNYAVVDIASLRAKAPSTSGAAAPTNSLVAGEMFTSADQSLFWVCRGSNFELGFFVASNTYAGATSLKILHVLSFGGSGSGGGNPKVLDAFPSADVYELDDLIAVDEEFYKLAVTDDTEPNLFEGDVGRDVFNTTAGERWRGISNSQSPNGFSTDGEFTANPNNTLSLLLASSSRHIRVAMKRSIYEAAKGSAFNTNDHIAIKVTMADGTTTDEAVLAYYNQYVRRDTSGTDTTYIIWQHRHASDNYNLYTEDAGNAIKIEFFTTSGSTPAATTTPLLTHAVASKHWIHWPTNDTPSADARAALNLAQANQARLDALDLHVDGDTEPLHTQTYDENTALLAPVAASAGNFAVSETFSNVLTDDLIVVDWRKCDHLNHHDEHVVPGSNTDAGRMYFYPRNFDTEEWDGEFLYGLERALQDNGSPDELNSWIVGSIVYSGSSLTFGLHLQQGGSRTNRNLKPRPGFSITVRVYRNSSVAATLETSSAPVKGAELGRLVGHNTNKLGEQPWTNLLTDVTTVDADGPGWSHWLSLPMLDYITLANGLGIILEMTRTGVSGQFSQIFIPWHAMGQWSGSAESNPMFGGSWKASGTSDNDRIEIRGRITSGRLDLQAACAGADTTGTLHAYIAK